MGNIEKWISSARKGNLIRGGFSVSTSKGKRIQDLLFWVNDSLCNGRVKLEAEFDETDFTTIKITVMDDDACINYLECKTNNDVSAP